MTPRRWGVGGWLVAVAAGLVAAGGLVGLLVWDRRLFLLAVGWMCSLWLAYRIPNRNLIAELEAVQNRLSAYNGSQSHEDLSKVDVHVAEGEVIHHCPPGGDGRTPCCNRSPLELPFDERLTVDPGLVTCRGPVEDPAPPSWMDQSGYRRPLATGGVVPSSSAVTFSESDGCVVPLQEWADRLAALPGCVWESCPHPENCTGECRWNIDQCPTCRDTGMVPETGNGSDGYYRCPDCPPALPDLDASDGPRSLPTPRVSD